MSVTIYHNPKCSKSRQTLELLSAKGITPTIIEYIKNPPTVEKLKEILFQLRIAPRDLMRKKEDIYKEETELDKYSIKDPNYLFVNPKFIGNRLIYPESINQNYLI